MNYSFFDFLNLCGGLGLFLFGMKMMSESLQKVAGSRMRKVLATMTRNRFMGVMSGLLITSVIQSSSATTVMVVSFVNAGLLTLCEAISVIMGANIGTTVTAWLVSLVGFKFSISDIAVPAIGLAIPLLFSKRDERKSFGELLVGFALLFIGLDFLKNSVPDINSNPAMLEFLKQYNGSDFGSILLFVFVGTVLTIIMQSSSATMAITLVIMNNGWISLDVAAAMVLGENIGTTITANLAAIPANTTAKRAALSHTLFNVFGVTWVLIFFHPFRDLVEWIVSLGGSIDPDPLYSLSMFHSLFNTINVLIMIWFVKIYEKVVCFLIKPRKGEDENEFKLKYITSNILSMGELSLLEADKEIAHFAERTQKMLFKVERFVMDDYKAKDRSDAMKNIESYEQASDEAETAIANYLFEVSYSTVNEQVKKDIRRKLNVVSEIESVADCCFNIAKAAARRNKEKIVFTDEQIHNIQKMFDLTKRQIDSLIQLVNNKNIMQNSDAILSTEKTVNTLRYKAKQLSINNVREGNYSYLSGTYYMDIMEENERLSDCVEKVAKEYLIQA